MKTTLVVELSEKEVRDAIKVYAEKSVKDKIGGVEVEIQPQNEITGATVKFTGVLN